MLKVDKKLDIGLFIDECFDFVHEYAPNSDINGGAPPVPKGTIRRENRVGKLRQQLNNNKNQAYKVSVIIR